MDDELMRMRVLACWVLVLTAICPQSVSAQVFLAARPKPAFEVGPLLITATVTDAIAPRTPIRIVWGIVPSSLGHLAGPLVERWRDEHGHSSPPASTSTGDAGQWSRVPASSYPAPLSTASRPVRQPIKKTP